jgi:hypothetical protein
MAHSSDADTDDSAVVRHGPPAAVSAFTDLADERSVVGDEHNRQAAFSRPLKIAYGIAFVVLAVSVVGFTYVHLHHAGPKPARADAVTTTSSAPPTTSTLALPTGLQLGAESAATSLISSWSTGNRAAALSVATPAAVTTLFAVPYASGQALDRGCSTSFTPIVCTFGPPGGASPTDPIYQIDVSQAAGGWYVSSVKIEN